MCVWMSTTLLMVMFVGNVEEMGGLSFFLTVYHK